MFEQAILANGPAGKRVWTTMMGVTGQVALVSLAILIPMVSPQVLPLAKIDLTFVPSLPPGPQHLGPQVKPAGHPAGPRIPFNPNGLVTPTAVPTSTPRIEDVPIGQDIVGNIGGESSPANNLASTVISQLVATQRSAVPFPVIKPTPDTKPAPVAPVEVQRLPEGGRVHLGAPRRRVEPPYPTIAQATRLSGAVQLECVVGIDGHIKEVKVISGSPLLVKAAVDAAWQWVYAPSRLNDKPIEIVTVLTFNFRLNR